jgi:ferredoxin--NADP+ reductase
MPHELTGFVNGVISAQTQWTETEFSITVSAQIQPYVSGQFTKLALRNTEGNWVRRAYSFVNSPNHQAGANEMEFLVISVRDGDLSPALAGLNIGDEVFVGDKPSGFMTLAEIPGTTKDLWLLSTGTAIGPFLAILEEQATEQRFDHVVLVHAVRTVAELVYQERIAALQARYQDKLRYIPIVSQEDCPTALSGRIPALIKSNQLFDAAKLQPTQQHSFFYLCGNPAMIHDTRDVLLELGFEKHLRRSAGQFSFENYW